MTAASFLEILFNADAIRCSRYDKTSRLVSGHDGFESDVKKAGIAGVIISEIFMKYQSTKVKSIAARNCIPCTNFLHDFILLLYLMMLSSS